MALLVGGVGALVLVYCVGVLLGAARRASAGSAGVLVAFAGSMLGLVTADDMLLLFVFWELTTVTSYLLIGHYADRKASRRAAMQAIIVTTAGGLAMLVGIVLLGRGGGHVPALRGHRRPAAGHRRVTVAVVLPAGRRGDQVGARPVPLLAARRDGRADARSARTCTPRRW